MGKKIKSFHLVANDDKLVDDEGYVISKREFSELMKQVLSFYMNVNQEEIDRYNKGRRKELKKG